MLMIVPATVVAQDIGASAPGFGANDWREEPNVAAPGRLPFNWYGSPSANYPADDNNLQDAQAGTRSLILQAKWMPYLWPATVACGTWSGVGCSGVFNPDQNNLLHPFLGKDFITPSHSTWMAFHGYWVDTNGDGFRDETGHWRNSVDGHDRQFFVNADPSHNCQQGAAPTVDPSGDTWIAGGQQGNLVPAAVVAPVGVNWECSTPDEWDPPAGWGTNNPTVVTYITPGDSNIVGGIAGTVRDPWGFDGPVLRIPCPIIGVHNDPETDCNPVPTQDTPDIDYTAGDFYGEGTYSWTGVFDENLDGSLLETKVTETISSPIRVADGPRTHEPGPDSLIDTDLYSSVDPVVESLFQNSLHGAEDAYNAQIDSTDDEFQDAFDQWEALSSQLVCHPDPAEAAFCITDPALGPAQVQFTGARGVEDTGYDHASGYHMYMDLEIFESADVGAQATALNGALIDPVCTDGQASSSTCGNLVRLEIAGNLGAWHDINGDGLVGDASTTDRTATCPDAYDCGTVRDPHEFSQVDSRDEWKPICPDGRKSGYVMVTLSPEGGRWGTLGAYVEYDESSDLESTQGARASFNPYDDIVLDAADGDLDRLVLEGDIPVTMTCLNNSGSLNSFEAVWLLGGRAEYAITMATETLSLAFESAGIVTPEDIGDTDVLEPYA